MTKTKKVLIVIGVLCLAAFVIGKFVSYRKAEKLKEQTAYALAHAPVEAKYMEHPAEYARQYVFAKVPPAGDFYEDENYRFQLLNGMTVKNIINGYNLQYKGSSLFDITEFSDWRAYLDYLRSGNAGMFVRKGIDPVFHYDKPFSFEALTPEAYGEILPDGQISYKLKTGEPVLEVLTRSSVYHGQKIIVKYVFIKKTSGHIVIMLGYYPFYDGNTAHVVESAMKLAVDSIVIKNPLSFSGLDTATVLYERRKWPEQTNR